MSPKFALVFSIIPILLTGCQADEANTASTKKSVQSIDGYSLIDACWTSGNREVQIGIVVYGEKEPASVFLASSQCYLNQSEYNKHPISDFRFRPRSIDLNGSVFSPAAVNDFDTFNALPEWPDQIIAAKARLKFARGGAFSDDNLPEVEILKGQNLPRELFGRFINSPADRAVLIEHYLEGSVIGVFDDNGYRDGDRN